jgi:hypothetical protein
VCKLPRAAGQVSVAYATPSVTFRESPVTRMAYKDQAVQGSNIFGNETDMLSCNVCMELPLWAAKIRRRGQISEKEAWNHDFALVTVNLIWCNLMDWRWPTRRVETCSRVPHFKNVDVFMMNYLVIQATTARDVQGEIYIYSKQKHVFPVLLWISIKELTLYRRNTDGFI